MLISLAHCLKGIPPLVCLGRPATFLSLVVVTSLRLAQRYNARKQNTVHLCTFLSQSSQETPCHSPVLQAVNILNKNNLWCFRQHKQNRKKKKKTFNCHNIYLSVTICVNSKVLYFMLIFVTYLSPLFATVDPIRNNRTAASCKCKKHCFINLLQSSKNAHFSSQFLRYHNDCTSLFLNLHIFKEPQTGFFSLLVFSEQFLLSPGYLTHRLTNRLNLPNYLD